MLTVVSQPIKDNSDAQNALSFSAPFVVDSDVRRMQRATLRECVHVHVRAHVHSPPQTDYSEHVQRDLLDALLRAKRSAENSHTAALSAESVGLSDDHVLMTVGDIFGAGVETTTTVLKWAITFLIHHPQVRRFHDGGTRVAFCSD